MSRTKANISIMYSNVFLFFFLNLLVHHSIYPYFLDSSTSPSSRTYAPLSYFPFPQYLFFSLLVFPFPFFYKFFTNFLPLLRFFPVSHTPLLLNFLLVFPFPWFPLIHFLNLTNLAFSFYLEFPFPQIFHHPNFPFSQLLYFIIFLFLFFPKIIFVIFFFNFSFCSFTFFLIYLTQSFQFR